MSKYNAKKFKVGSITFDSKMEADFYYSLIDWQREGLIAGFTMQPEYELQPKFKKRGVLFRAINYKADFNIQLNNGEIVTVDVKGFETADFKLKRKMFEHKFPQELKLVTYSKIDGGWIETEPLKVARKIRKFNKELVELGEKVTLEYNDVKRMSELESKIESLQEKFNEFKTLKEYFEINTF